MVARKNIDSVLAEEKIVGLWLKWRMKEQKMGISVHTRELYCHVTPLLDGKYLHRKVLRQFFKSLFLDGTADSILDEGGQLRDDPCNQIVIVSGSFGCRGSGLKGLNGLGGWFGVDNWLGGRLRSNNPANINISTLNIQEAKKNLEKPLLRRKSDLPKDILTQNSLDSYQRADEFLTTPGTEASSDS